MVDTDTFPQKDFLKRVMVFPMKHGGEREFLKDVHLFGPGMLLRGLGDSEEFVDLIYTDKPYGILKKDGNVSDAEIPDADVKIICQRFHTLTKHVLFVHFGLFRMHISQGRYTGGSTSSKRLAPSSSLCEHQVHVWKQHLTAAGFWCERSSTWAMKDEQQTKWLPPTSAQSSGMRPVGNYYVIAHKVTHIA